MMDAIALAVFWSSVALVVYTYAGYPLLAWLLAVLRPRPVRKGAALPTVTAILSVHDAERTVEAKLENLLSLDYPEDRLDIIVVCDGCTDGTEAACRRYQSPRVRVLASAVRRGKAASLAEAAALATGEVLLMVDVRQRIEREALRRLVANFSDPEVGAVSGELCFVAPGGGFSASVDAYWRYEKAIRDAEARSGSVVGVTGAFYAIRRALYAPLPPGTVLDDVLTPMQVVRAGSRVVFEADAVAWDRASRSPADERVRKVRTLAGNYQLLALAPWLASPWHNRLWFRFVSHKLLRLAAPWVLCALAAATAILAPSHPFYLACLYAGLACIAVALAGPRLPLLSGSLPVRLLAAFWHMNVYAGQALLAYARNPRLHLW
jgi:cellulose synthase/poly-beta-1,6-N-acetylglucosamine synthase-like glycosyltransferase